MAGHFADIAAVLLAQGQAGSAEQLLTFAPFIVVGILFYMMLIRPERRKRAEMDVMLANLKKNDRVVTVGGIHGTVISATKGSKSVTLKVDESTNTKLRVQRSAISRVEKDDESSESKTTSSEA